MWPLRTEQIVEITLGRLVAGATPPPQDIIGLSTDSRALSAGQLFVPLKGETFDGLQFASQVLMQAGSCVMVPTSWWQAASPPAPHKTWAGACLVVDDVLVAFRRLAAAFRQGLGAPRPRALAVGGSNGKTTTKEMIVALLGGRSPALVATRKSENGFVGIPKTLCGADMTRAVTRLVLEVGIDEPGSMSQHCELVKPDVALLTSLSHEHLEGLGTLENVVREELVLMTGPWQRIWQLGDELIRREALPLLRVGDWCVGPLGPSQQRDQAWLRAAMQAGCGAVTYTTAVSADLSQVVELVVSPPRRQGWPTRMEPLCVHLSLAMPGEHNAANAALAFAAALAMQLGLQHATGLEGEQAAEAVARLAHSMSDAFKHFSPPDMRSKLEHFADGSVLLADCYNSNPASLRASLASLRAPSFALHQKWLFLGDMLDLGSESERLHDELIFDLESMPDCQLYLYGQAMYPIYSKLQQKADHKVVLHLARDKSPEQWLEALPPRVGPVFVLVKGSRGMAMERLLPGLRRYLEQT